VSGPTGGPGAPSAATTVVGVIGDPVAHSLSPLLHNTAFAAFGLDWVSVGFPVPAGEAPAALAGARALGLAGLSVTMPHKDAVADLVDECTAVARRLGAVNCVIRRKGRFVGDNTDGEGFVASLRRGATFEPAGRRCLVAGAGGAARAVVLALAEAGAAEVVVVNRTPGRAETAAALAGSVGRVGRPEEAGSFDLVVNATPLGMAGAGAPGAEPVDPALLHPGQLVVDLVYAPRRTPWLARAEGRGAVALSGLGMLVHQAAAQLRRWTGEEPPTDRLWEVATAATDAAPG